MISLQWFKDVIDSFLYGVGTLLINFVVVLHQKVSFERIQKLSIQEAKHEAREGQFKML